MNSTYYKDKIVVGIIKNKKTGKVLLAKVKKAKLDEFGSIEYVFPGGRVEEGEFPGDALHREILDETGYDVDIKGQVSYRVHPVTKKEIYYYSCVCDLNKQKTSISDEDIESLIWVDVKDLDKYLVNLNPDVQKAILHL